MNKVKLFLAMLAFTGLSASLTAQTYSGGIGTETDPYRISSRADMEALATAVNGGTTQSGRHFLLTQDITEAVTTIVGNSNSRSFSGIFDGGWHEVNAYLQHAVYLRHYFVVGNRNRKSDILNTSACGSNYPLHTKYLIEPRT